MSRDDIIRLARDAGASSLHGGETALFGDAALERFAALVEQHLISQGYRKCAKGQRTTQFCGLLEDAVKAEREACIQDVRAYVGIHRYDTMKIVESIRARGENK